MSDGVPAGKAARIFKGPYHVGLGALYAPLRLAGQYLDVYGMAPFGLGPTLDPFAPLVAAA